MLSNCGAGEDSWESLGLQESILKEISSEYSLEGLMLKLKLQYFGHMMRRTDLREDPDAGKDWRQKEKAGGRGWDGWITSLTQRTSIWANSWRQWRTEEPGMLQSVGSQWVGHNLATTHDHHHLTDSLHLNLQARTLALLVSPDRPPCHLWLLPKYVFVCYFSSSPTHYVALFCPVCSFPEDKQANTWNKHLSV